MGSPVRRGSLSGASLRPFGRSPEDLDLDFRDTPRPQLVTGILRRCIVEPPETAADPEAVWDLTVGERIAGLLRIMARTGERELPLEPQCRAPECGRRMETALAVDELLDAHREAGEREVLSVRLDGRELRLRRPTGRDQLGWQSDLPGADPEARSAEVLRTLLVDSPAEDTTVTVDEVRAVAEAMETFDPLVNVILTVRCPYCDRPSRYEIDVQEEVLARLRRIQRRLIEEVHRLALDYHWTEAEVMALPAWRRARYLRLVERDVEG